MAYTLPNFNLVADLWFFPHSPQLGGPDLILVPCQLYLPSRGAVDIDYGAGGLYFPPIYLRLDPASGPYDPLAWIIGLPDDPPTRSLYYRVHFREWTHLGFPNQYQSWILFQCNDAGTPRPRDVY